MGHILDRFRWDSEQLSEGHGGQGVMNLQFRQARPDEPDMHISEAFLSVLFRLLFLMAAALYVTRRCVRRGRSKATV